MITKFALGLAFALLVAQAANLRNESNEVRRARLDQSCSGLPQWRVEELEHYFLFTNVTDRGVTGELAERVDAIRRHVIWMLDPVVQCTPGPSHPNPNLPPSKTVLRLYSKADTYFSAGGPTYTYGYYAPERTEIELFNSPTQKERLAMFQTAQRLVVRETLDTYLARGEHAPWFELGLTDYFGDFALRNGQLEQQPDAIRAQDLHIALREGHCVPLPEFVALRRSVYDGLAPERFQDVNALRAEGWAFMRFLMERDAHAVGRSEFVDRYLAKWREKPDGAAATAFAFAGVDWDALEREWRAFVENTR